jgi:hypothetical protein
MRAISRWPALRSVTVSGLHAPLEALRELAACATLQTLALAGCRLPPNANVEGLQLLLKGVRVTAVATEAAGGTLATLGTAT